MSLGVPAACWSVTNPDLRAVRNMNGTCRRTNRSVTNPDLRAVRNGFNVVTVAALV